MRWWRVEDIVLLNRCRVDGEARADDPSHGCRGEQGGASRSGDHGSGVARRRTTTRTGNTRRCHGEVTPGPNTVRAGRWQVVEAVDHGSTGHGIVRARHTVAGGQRHAGVAVEGERVERAVGEEAVGGRLLGLVGIVDTASRGNSRRVTSSLGGSLGSCAGGATRTSCIATKLMAMDSDAIVSRDKRVRKALVPRVVIFRK